MSFISGICGVTLTITKKILLGNMNRVSRIWENINVQSAEVMQIQIGFPFARFKLLT